MIATTRALAYERPLTHDDLLMMPDDGERREIISGELVVNPAPPSNHQRVFLRLSSILDGYALETGAGEVLPAPFDVILGRFDVVQPDLIFLLGNRPRVPGNENSIDYPPDLVVEIISPSSRGTDRGKKMALYARSGVTEYWIADPERRTLAINVLQGDDYRAVDVNPDCTLTSRILSGLRVDPAAVFARLD